MFVFGVILVCIFPHSDWIIQNTDFFHAVSVINYFCKSLHFRCLTGLSIRSALNSKFSEFSDIFAKMWPTDLSNGHYDSTVRLHDIFLDYLADYFQFLSFWSTFCVNIMINLKLIFFILYLELVLFQYL